MKTVLSIIILFIITSLNFAQPKEGNIGLSVAVQQSQFDFLVPIFVKDNLSLSPSLGMASISGQYTDVSLGGVLRYYFTKNTVSPYIGGRFGIMMFNLSKATDTSTDILFGLMFGGEHYFTQNFSAGIEAGLNLAKSGEKSNRFNNPGGTNISTSTAFFATIYF